MKWPDSLFARIFLLQVVAGLSLAGVFTALLFNEQASLFARATATLWAASLQPVQQQLAQGVWPVLPTPPQQATTAVQIQLQTAPPTGSDHLVPLLLRHRVLRTELRALGLPVQRMTINTDRTSITWLELPYGTQSVWIGVAGEFEGANFRQRAVLGILITVGIFIAGAAWLSRRIAQPLQDLQASVKAFSNTGQPQPDPLARISSGPVEVRQLAHQFAEFAKQQAAQDEARNVMLAGISHDLRSPLARIRMAAELLPDVPGVQDRKSSIVRNCQTADRLVGSFLDLARAAAEPLEERVDLSALVRAVLSTGDHGLVQFEVQRDGPLWLAPASTAALERVLVNLLDNAAKYGRATTPVDGLSPPVIVQLASTPTHALLTVRDHGPGIAADQLLTLRKAFYRGTHDRGSPGSGLGLSIVERSVKRHGGTLEMHNAGPGLAVVLQFPLAAPD